MSASLAATLALVLAATASAQDQPAPSIFQGKWSGQQQAAFGAASATDPNSLECIPNGGIITSKPISLTIGNFNVLFSGAPASASSQGPATFSRPASPAANFTWAVGPSGGANASSGVVQLRVSPTTLQCYYMQVTGSGSSRKLSVAVLGGAGQGYDTQCSSASYASIPNLGSVPYCQAASGSRSPLVSTVLQTYDFKGDASASGAGAAGLAGLAVLGVAAAALAAV